MTTQNISLDATLKTASTGSTGARKKAHRLTKKELRNYWSAKITALHLEEKERKQNQQL